jgi:hypothetical protein
VPALAASGGAALRLNAGPDAAQDALLAALRAVLVDGAGERAPRVGGPSAGPAVPGA